MYLKRIDFAHDIFKAVGSFFGGDGKSPQEKGYCTCVNGCLTTAYIVDEMRLMKKYIP